MSAPPIVSGCESAMPSLATTIRLVSGTGAIAVLLVACGDRNAYQPPPPAEVSVAKPEQRKVTLYMEVTGATAPFNRVDLVARVQGFLEKVGYKDGAAVKKGDLLFQIDKQDYEIALQIAEATQQQQEALLLQAEADLKRKQDLVKTSSVSVAQVDDSRAKRDSTLAAGTPRSSSIVNRARRGPSTAARLASTIAELMGLASAMARSPTIAPASG